MNERALHECRLMQVEDLVASASAAAGYLELVQGYAKLGDQAGIKHVLHCGRLCLISALKAYNDLTALDAPAELREAAE